MQANHSTTCPLCNTAINIGDEIGRTNNRLLKEYAHKSCVPQSSPVRKAQWTVQWTEGNTVNVKRYVHEKPARDVYESVLRYAESGLGEVNGLTILEAYR